MNNNASPNTSLDASSSEAAALAELQARNRLLEAEVARLRAHQEAIAHGISHDLRGPLRAIDGFAAQIERAGSPPSETGASPQASRIRAAAARMGDLIDSLLEYSQVGRRELVRVPIDIDFLADWALMELRDRHPEAKIDAAVQPGLKVLGDERLLKALLGKLFDNSRRFADPARGARISLTGERDGDGLHLRIADEGTGMEMRHSEQPFEPFRRLHSSSQGAGDGMGLAIARSIVECHQGRIWAESTPGQGATIHVWLPD